MLLVILKSFSDISEIKNDGSNYGPQIETYGQSPSELVPRCRQKTALSSLDLY